MEPDPGSSGSRHRTYDLVGGHGKGCAGSRERASRFWRAVAFPLGVNVRSPLPSVCARGLAVVASVGILGLTSVPRFLSVGQSVAAQSGAQTRTARPSASDMPEWMRALAVRPGSSLPEETPLRQQVVTFFSVSEQRREGITMSWPGRAMRRSTVAGRSSPG